MDNQNFQVVASINTFKNLYKKKVGIHTIVVTLM